MSSFRQFVPAAYLLMLGAFASGIFFASQTACADAAPTAGVSYRITLWQGADPAKAVTLEGDVAELENGAKSYPQADVKVISQIDASGQQQWRIDVTPAEDFGVYSVEFPIIDLTATLGDKAQRLLASYGDGAAFDNLPERQNRKDQGALPRLRDGIWYGVYPSNRQVMQLMIIDDGDDHGDGVMIWTPDGDANVKDFTLWKNDADHLLASVTLFPGNTGRPGVGLHMNFPVTITPFAGGWNNATDIYRDWAVQQFWCSKGTLLDRVASGELPEWYATQALWTTALDYKRSGEMLRQIREILPDGAIGVFLTQWQQNGFDVDTPGYFPPNDPEGYAKLMAMQDELNIRMYPYMNIHLTSRDMPGNGSLLKQAAKQGPPASTGWYMTDYVEYWGTDLRRKPILKAELEAAWDGPFDKALVAKVQSDWYGGYPYQREAAAKLLGENWGGDRAIIDQVASMRAAFIPMCSAAPAWRDAFSKLVTTNHHEYGCDGHYLDQLNTNGIYPCFSESHGHKPGFGQAPWKGRRELVELIREKNPGMPLFGECTSEVYLDLVQDYFGQYPQYYDNDSVPLYASVYHGYASRHEAPTYAGSLGDPQNFAAVLAIAVYLGKKPGSFVTTTTWLELVKPEHKTSQEFMRQIVRLMVDNPETLLHGRRLHDPVIENAPMQNVTWYLNKPGTKTKPATVPAVRASMWQSHQHPEQRVLLLSNTSDQAQTVTLTSQDIAKGAVLHGAGEQTVTASPAVTVEVPPLSWQAWTYEAK